MTIKETKHPDRARSAIAAIGYRTIPLQTLGNNGSPVFHHIARCIRRHGQPSSSLDHR
ncbi:hypothetical protein [Chlorobium phaeobacteroides]|uniref:hypothetical protein n=1 Tax=Chlorobium phaeobacteroides TaxID=1096 RepID=UPI0003156FDD|nr:hypothetical protein [Chlorobium phaeobacteroides]